MSNNYGNENDADDNVSTAYMFSSLLTLKINTLRPSYYNHQITKNV